MPLVHNDVDVEIVQLLLLLLLIPPLFLLSQIVVYSCFCFHNHVCDTKNLITIPLLSVPPLPLFVMYCTSITTCCLFLFLLLLLLMMMMIYVFVGLVMLASHAIISTAAATSKSDTDSSSSSSFPSTSSFHRYRNFCCPCTLVYYHSSITATTAVLIVDKMYIILTFVVSS